MSDRFLIDECLSAALVATAKSRGIEADHVVHLGKSGWQDWNLVALCVANDYIFVTSNRRDFLKEYAKLEIHAGLVVIVPRGNRADQISDFGSVLDMFEAKKRDLVNRLVEIIPDRSLEIRPWNSRLHDIRHIGNPEWSRSK